jgi:hypothetical protein
MPGVAINVSEFSVCEILFLERLEASQTPKSQIKKNTHNIRTRLFFRLSLRSLAYEVRLPQARDG